MHSLTQNFFFGNYILVDVQSKMDLDSDEFEMMGQDLPPVPLSGGDVNDSSSKSFLSEVTNSGIPAFPWRLHDMLNDAETQSYEHIVSWQNGDEGFKVHDPKVFVQSIMPKYFNQTQYKSFQRQLNIYGFQGSKENTQEIWFHCCTRPSQRVGGFSPRHSKIIFISSVQSLLWGTLYNLYFGEHCKTEYLSVELKS
jgi:hypothetical protein